MWGRKRIAPGTIYLFSVEHNGLGQPVCCALGDDFSSTEIRPSRGAQRMDSDAATVVWRAAYDGDGGRRKRLDAGGTVHYVGSYERNVGNGQDTTETVTKYYHALGRPIAFRKGGTLYWVGTDHLGGTVRVADASFNPVARKRYTPYGVSRDSDQANTDHLFTSQVLDESLGLYWYASRAYDPLLARFTQPDSIVPEPGNPQDFNRHAYTANNPLRYRDPSGHVNVPLEGDNAVDETWNGYTARVVRNATGKDLEMLKARNALAMVPGPGKIIAEGDLTRGLDTYKHEMAHVAQASIYRSDFEWQSAYVREWVRTGLIHGFANAYAMHSWERAANRAAGLPEFWHVGGAPPAPPPIRWGTADYYHQYLQPSPTSALPGAPSGSGAVDLGQIEFMLPAEFAPGGVGVTGMTAFNPSGTPDNGENWVSPGGETAEDDAAARQAAWERAGSPDYSRPTHDDGGNVNGYYSVYE